MHPTISKRKPYSPHFNPNQFSPALWLDGADASTLITDGAASFTAASSQYLEVADNSTLRLGNTLFIACWIYPTTFNASPTYFIAKDGNTLGTREFGISFDVNGIVLFSLGGSSSGGGIPNLTLNAWNFVACWYDSQDNKHYRNVNGTVSTGTTITPYSAFGTLASFRLGSRIVSDPYFDGRLDSVVYLKPSVGWLVSNATALCSYLYNSGAGRRSSNFINSSFYSGSGAVSWWDLDEVTGTRKDRIGTNDLTDNNSVGYASGIASGNVQYDGDPVKQWNDKSGNAQHVTAATIATSPTYKTNIQNSNSSVLFDGVNDCFKILNQPFFRNISNGTIICVRKSALAATNAYKTLIEISTTADSTRAAIYHTDTAKKLQIAGSNTDGGSPSYISATNDATTNAEILTGFFNYKNASVSLYLNNTLIISNNYFGTGNLNPGQFTPDTNCYALSVGATSYAAGSLAFFNGYIYEIFVFNKLLTSIEYQKIKQYLANKWGITLS